MPALKVKAEVVLECRPRACVRGLSQNWLEGAEPVVLEGVRPEVALGAKARGGLRG